MGDASGYKGFTVGRGGARLIAGMTDGTAVISGKPATAGELDGFHIQNITIVGSFTGVVAGGARNCIGLDLGTIGGDPGGSGAATACSRGTLDNVLVYGCAVGLKSQGWIQTFRRVLLHLCNVGYVGEHNNASSMDFLIESCGQGFQILQAYSLFIARLLDEGAVAYRSASSTVDACRNLTIGNYYVESEAPGLAYPWLVVGGTTECLDTNILTFLCPDAPAAGGVAPIHFEKADRFSVNSVSSSGSVNAFHTYTASERYSRNDRSPAPRMAYVAPNTNRRDGMQHAALDLLPNSYCEGLRFGCENAFVPAGGVVVSEETTIVRTGTSALRITSAVGANNCALFLRFYDAWAVPHVQQDDDGVDARKITFGAWVWVPNLAGMQYPTDASPFIPTLGIFRYDSGGSAGANVAITPNQHVVKGRWNFMHCCLAGDYTVTVESLALALWPHYSPSVNAPAAPDTPYIIVDSMHLAFGDCWEAMYEGRIQSSPSATGFVKGGRLTVYKTQANAATMIADTTQTYKVGDKVIYIDPASGGYEGQVCTTAGAGGSAVWKGFGLIA